MRLRGRRLVSRASPTPAVGQVPLPPLINQYQSDQGARNGQINPVWALSVYLADGVTAGSAVLDQTVYFGTDPVQVRLGPGGTATAQTVSASATSLNHTGLPPGTYHVGVSARNAAGQSAVSTLWRVTVTS